MIHFLLLMMVPFLISVGALVAFKKQDSLADLGIQVGVVALVMMLGLGFAYWSRTSDTEILDGQVTGKERVKVSCEHSYQCNCYYTTDSKGNTTEHCSTCYEHPYDVDWRVYSNLGRTFFIHRIDRQGLIVPPHDSRLHGHRSLYTDCSWTNLVRSLGYRRRPSRIDLTSVI